MGFSPLADMGRRIPDVGRSQPRLSPVSGFTIHHNAGVDAFGQATAPNREVSANYWITNAGVILPNVDESRRAFTSGAVGYPGGAEADHRHITVEVSNDGGPGWSISDAARDALARLIGDVYSRYNLGPVKRGTHSVAVHRDFVPTECPGPYIMAQLGDIITAAEGYRAPAVPEEPTKREKVFTMGKHIPKPAIKLGSTWKRLKTGITTRIVGSYRTGSVTLTVVIQGPAGAQVQIAPAVERKSGPGVVSGRLRWASGVIPARGVLKLQVTSNFTTGKGECLRPVAIADTGKNVKITHVAWDLIE